MSSLKSRASVCLPYVILTLYAAVNDLNLDLVENFPSEKNCTRNACKTNLSKEKGLLI